LECAVFTEDITSVEHIGGWRRIQRKSSKDYERLVQRIQESQIEIIQEQEEIQPDELVQVNFEGEMRAPPKGLTATLLPFQVEGVSWMHHQEMNAPEIRGGILADGK
jgi:SNF2 family DNA or RNA helicase